MFGWRWVRFKKSCWRLSCTFLATAMSGGFATGLLSNASASDAASRVLAATPISLVLWVWAFFVGRSFVDGQDRFLFAISPLTPGRFFARNLKNFRVVHGYLFIVLPWLVWWVASFGTAQSFDPWILFSAVLAYYCILLAPAAEHLGGPWSPTRLLFAPRHLLRFGVIPVGTAVAAIVAVFYFAPEVSQRTARSVAEALLDRGAVGLAFITMLSPASAVAAVADPNPQSNLLVGLSVVLATLFAWEVFVISRAFFGSVSEFEEGELEAWLEHRKNWLEGAEQAGDEEQEAINKWTEDRAVLTTAEPVAEDGPQPGRSVPELEDVGGLPYDATYTPEAQMLRHATYAQRAAGVSGMLAFLRHNWIRMAAILFIVLINFGRFDAFNKTSVALAAIGVFILFARGMVVTGLATAWEPITRLGMAVPVRVPRLAAHVWGSRMAVDALWDVLAAVAFVVLAGAPWWAGVALLIVFQLVRLSGNLRLWLLLTRRKGTRQDISLYQCVEILVGIGAVVTLVMVSTRSELRGALENVQLYAVLVGLYVFVIAYGGTTLFWRHCRADTSLPRNILSVWGSE